MAVLRLQVSHHFQMGLFAQESQEQTPTLANDSTWILVTLAWHLMFSWLMFGIYHISRSMLGHIETLGHFGLAY